MILNPRPTQMNKSLTLATATLLMGAASALAYDGSVKVSSAPSQYRGGNGGGAFLVDTSGTGYGLSVSGLKTGMLGQASDSFLTFCIEKDEYLSTSGNDRIYDANVSNSADRGGNNTNSGDPVSKATAWLFSEFSNGTLSNVNGFNYNSDGAEDLQNAIWWLEQEQGSSTPSWSYRYLVDAAMSEINVATYALARSTDANGYLGVMALNLYNGDPKSKGNKIDGVYYNQDILVIVPEPTTYIAGGLALLPLLFGLRTRLSRK